LTSQLLVKGLKKLPLFLIGFKGLPVLRNEPDFRVNFQRAALSSLIKNVTSVKITKPPRPPLTTLTRDFALSTKLAVSFLKICFKKILKEKKVSEEIGSYKVPTIVLGSFFKKNYPILSGSAYRSESRYKTKKRKKEKRNRFITVFSFDF